MVVVVVELSRSMMLKEILAGDHGKLWFSSEL